MTNPTPPAPPPWASAIAALDQHNTLWVHVIGNQWRSVTIAGTKPVQRINVHDLAPDITQWIKPHPPACPTCSGPIRETVGMVCQTCGTDCGTAT